jgi:hypothetical protein
MSDVCRRLQRLAMRTDVVKHLQSNPLQVPSDGQPLTQQAVQKLAEEDYQVGWVMSDARRNQHAQHRIIHLTSVLAVVYSSTTNMVLLTLVPDVAGTVLQICML